MTDNSIPYTTSEYIDDLMETVSRNAIEVNALRETADDHARRADNELAALHSGYIDAGEFPTMAATAQAHATMAAFYQTEADRFERRI